jgi:hypothetical protein
MPDGEHEVALPKCRLMTRSTKMRSTAVSDRRFVDRSAILPAIWDA